MYQVTTGIHIHFAHHVRGHSGPCISVHGHTWLFQLTLGSRSLNSQGFVADFDDLHQKVLGPCHRLLDHALAVGEKTYREGEKPLAELGRVLVLSRKETLGHTGDLQDGVEGDLCGARNFFPGGIKICVFPFAPTSERIAEWLYRLGDKELADDRIKLLRARVYESLSPVESFADFAAPSDA